MSYAKGLAYAAGLPFLGVHHIASHIAANYLSDPSLEPPFTCLVVSGGHSHIILVEDYDRFRLIEGADIYQVAKNCRTSVEMIEKFYASHIKDMIDASAINTRRPKR